MTTAKDHDDVQDLIQAARELAAKVEALTVDRGNAVVGLAEYAQSTRRMMWFVIVGFILDIALTVAMVFATISIQHNNTRIDKVTQRLDNAQTVQRAKALCPLYEIFLASEKLVPPDQTPDQAAARAHAFEVIHTGYDALGCAQLK